MTEDRREIYQQNLEMELLTESRLGAAEWFREALEAAKSYARQFPSDPYAYSVAANRLNGRVFSIAEVRRAAKERWVL